MIWAHYFARCLLPPDALNRNTRVIYTNDPASTPIVTRIFDGATNGAGRLWKTYTSGSTASRTTINSFDDLGRPTSQSQEFYSGGVWSAPFSVAATYDKAGHVITQTYPSWHTVNYVYDNAGRTSSFSGNLGEGVPRTYANEFKYGEFGGVQQEKFGTDTPLYHKQRYNERGQLWDMRLSTVSFAADPANGDRGSLVNYYSDNFVQGGSNDHNNGTLRRQETYIPGSDFFQENFSYDSLNRLTAVAEKLNGTGNDTFKQGYTIDRWGNRIIDQTHTTANVPHPNYTVDTNTNRLIAPSGADYSYDAGGNQTNDTYTGAGARTYDAENHLKQAWANNQWQTYTYDAEGQRTRRYVPSANGRSDPVAILC